MKLKRKIPILFVLAAVLPVFLVLGSTLWRLQADFKQDQLLEIEHHLESGANNIAIEFSNAMSEVEIYTQTEAVQSMDVTRFLPFLTDQIQRQNNKYEKFIVGTPEGFFYNTRGGNPYLGGLRSFDDKDPNAKPKHIRQRDYWQKTVGENSSGDVVTIVSNPMISYTSGAKQIVVASSILDNYQKVVGMLGASIEWDRIDKVMDDVVEHYFAEFSWLPKLMLISADGTYWYHWDPAKVVSVKLNDREEAVKNSDGQIRSQSFSLLDEDSLALVGEYEKIVNGQSGVLKYKNIDSGNNDYFFYHPIGETGYSLSLTVSEDALKTPFIKSEQIYMLLVLSVFIIVIGAGMWATNSISRPLSRIAKHVRLIQEGVYSEKIQMHTQDEFQDIAETLNDMSDAIIYRENSLRKSEQRFEYAMAGANDGLWDWDLKVDTVYYSKRWKEMLGYGENELENHLVVFFELLDEDSREGVRAYIEEFLASGKLNYHISFRMRHKSGYFIDILSKAFLIRDSETDEPLRLVGTHVDISEQIRNEKEIIQLNVSLEKRVQERTKELEKANEKLEKLSLLDGLLGIANRRAMDADLIHIDAVYARNHCAYSVLIIDIDYFKLYNDEYGHLQGDKALQAVSTSITDSIRNIDSLYRYGGEELLVLLPDTDISSASQIARRIILDINNLDIPHVKSPYGSITVSIGVAEMSIDKSGWKDVVKCADNALYEAKKSGRNQLVEQKYVRA